MTMKKLLIPAVMLFALTLVYQNKTNAQGFNVGADFVSRYVWRGLDFANSPSIQPTLSYTTEFGLEIGYWGAYSTTPVNYQETDLYVAYNIKDVVSIGVTDYFFPDGSGTYVNNNYFEYGEDKTGHIFEANLSFNGVEAFPISISANYNFYGADANNSFYGELGYDGNCKGMDYSIFAGFTSGKGIYLPAGTDGFSFVNVGLTVSKEIQITEKFSLPVMSSLVINPQAENIFLVFGFTL